MDSVGSYLEAARTEFGRVHLRQAVENAGMAFEDFVYRLAPLARTGARPTDVANALDVLVANGVVAEDTKKALSVRNVSLWGWLCVKGRHAGNPTDHPAEAQFAIDWAGAAIVMLANSYMRWTSEQRRTGR